VSRLLLAGTMALLKTGAKAHVWYASDAAITNDTVRGKNLGMVDRLL